METRGNLLLKDEVKAENQLDKYPHKYFQKGNLAMIPGFPKMRTKSMLGFTEQRESARHAPRFSPTRYIGLVGE